MRCGLIKVSDFEHRFIWSHHHILMDGWSLPIVLKDIVSYYERAKLGASPDSMPSRPFRDYILWLQKQDLSQSEPFWREMLQGFTTPTPLPFDNLYSPSEGLEYGELQIQLTQELSAAIDAYARKNQLTQSTIFQGAWGLLLNRYSGETDVLFGSTISGRPPDLPGSDKIVGLFINTLPAHAKISPNKPVISLLKSFQEQQIRLQQFGYSPLIDIQAWSELPARVQLFDSIFVFENYPWNPPCWDKRAA